MPLISSGSRPPRGYSPLNTQDDESSPSPDIAGDSQDPGSETSELARNKAWFSLTWSFLASSVLTVFNLIHSLIRTELETCI